MTKQYGDVSNYEAKLQKVMKRLGVDNYYYDWTRRSCFVEFWLDGQYYRFDHSIENAKAHGQNVVYGSDVFAQVVLALEDIARITERGIYELQTWISGLKSLPPANHLQPCFSALGFSQRPESVEDVKLAYKRLAKVMHPDGGGSDNAFQTLTQNFEKCIAEMGGES